MYHVFSTVVPTERGCRWQDKDKDKDVNPTCQAPPPVDSALHTPLSSPSDTCSIRISTTITIILNVILPFSLHGRYIEDKVGAIDTRACYNKGWRKQKYFFCSTWSCASLHPAVLAKCIAHPANLRFV